MSRWVNWSSVPAWCLMRERMVAVFEVVEGVTGREEIVAISMEDRDAAAGSGFWREGWAERGPNGGE